MAGTVLSCVSAHVQIWIIGACRRETTGQQARCSLRVAGAVSNASQALLLRYLIPVLVHLGPLPDFFLLLPSV